MTNNRIVYCLRRPDKIDILNSEDDEPFYFGKGVLSRAYSHRKEALKLWNDPTAKNSNPIRNRIIHKLWEQGLDFIEDIIFTKLDNMTACEYEIEAIAVYGRIDLGTGCLANLTNGGEGAIGLIFSEEHKRKLSENHWDCSGENHPLWNTYHSEETIKLMSEVKIGENNPRWGAHWSEEWKQELSIKYTGEGNPFYHREHDLKARESMSISHTGVPLSEDHKQAIKDGHPRLTGEDHWAWGTHQSEETKNKRAKSIRCTCKYRRWEKLISELINGVWIVNTITKIETEDNLT